MGLLDELEQESQRRKASLSDAERIQLEKEQAYKTQLEPGLLQLYEYLSKLLNNLSFLKPLTKIQHTIPGYGAVVASIDHDYELKTSNPTQTSKEITLAVGATVISDECAAIQVVGAAKIRTLNSFFQKNRLAGLQEFKKDESGEITQATFKARGRIPLSITISADAESAVVRMVFNNFDAIGSITKTVGPAQFNEQLFDDIGRYIARETSGLFRETLPEDFRKQLQQKLQQENLKRKWESKIAEQRLEETNKVKPEKSFKQHIDRAVHEVKNSGPSLLHRMKGIFKKD